MLQQVGARLGTEMWCGDGRPWLHEHCAALSSGEFPYHTRSLISYAIYATISVTTIYFYCFKTVIHDITDTVIL